MTVEARPQRLHPGTIIVHFLKAAPQQVIGAPALIAIFSDMGLSRALLLIIAIAAVSIFFRALAWWRFTYTILPQELYIESGVLSRTKRSIPWDRVQDVNIESDIFARLFGWAKVKLETGGAGKDEGSLDSIAMSDALALRDMVRSRRGHSAVAPGHEETPLPAFTMPPARLFQAGLFNFSVLWLAFLFGAYQLFDDWLPFDEDDVTSWIGANEAMLLGYATVRTIALAIGLFIVLGLLSGIAQMVVTNFGFRLTVEGPGLRRVRGLFTRSEILIPRKRIQLATITRRWVSRRLGFAKVAVQTLGGDAVLGGSQDLAPLAKDQEIAELVALAGDFDLPDVNRLSRVSPAHARIDALEGTVALLTLTLIAAWFWPPALWALLLVPPVAILCWIVARPHGWLIEKDQLSVRRGWFSQTLTLFPLRNIQACTIERGPVQRRLGLATIALDSAGGNALGTRISNLQEKDALSLLAFLRGRARKVQPPSIIPSHCKADRS